MRAALVFVLILCAITSVAAQQFNITTGPAIPVYARVADLPNSAVIGSIAFAANCRAFIFTASTGLGTVTYTVTMQASGAGTGCLVSFSGNAWAISGSTATALQ